MFEALAISAAIVSVIAAVINLVITWRRRKKYLAVIDELLKYYQAVTGHAQAKKGADYRLAELRSKLTELLDNCSSVLSDYSRAPIFASVKLFGSSDPDKQSLILYTVARDSVSVKERELLEAEYPIELNPPFMKIFDPDEPSYFINNDIQSPQDGGYYNKQDIDWGGLYKSTLIVPISGEPDTPNTPDTPIRSVLGFLVFDSPKRSVFNKEMANTAISIGKVIGSMLLKFYKPKFGVEAA